ncbi:MAG: hypothetical protein CMO80_14180 [Verrucomicrobiales bacterium]|nr:hypothetical protein [Verrucomicrobiales bacterium]|tara:strand:- start:646 stop:1410 length:765 start_codon:yes stop_codon:yes gene_type:complete
MLAETACPAWAQNSVLCTIQADHESSTPYFKYGSYGIHRDNPGVAVLKSTHDAVQLARAAMKESSSPSVAWQQAADAFTALPDLPESWQNQADNPIIAKQLNLVHVLKMKPEIITACQTAALYHDPNVHVKKDEIKTMAQMALSITKEHLVCPHRICSRLNLMEYEDRLGNAHAVEQKYGTQTTTQTAEELTNEYQKEAAFAQLHYNLVLSEMVTPEMKQKMADLTARITKTYSSTFPGILAEIKKEFKPLIVK